MRLIFTFLILLWSLQIPLANTIVHTEDFNNCGSVTWNTVRGSGDSEAADEWSCTSFGGRIYMEFYDNDGNNDEDWLISPAFNLDNYDIEFFSFEYNNNTAMNGLTLLYSTDYDGSGTGTAVSNATWNSLSTDLYDNANDTYISNYLFQRSIDLSAITGTSVYLAFRYISQGSGTQGWSIDNVRLTADYYADIIADIDAGDKCYDLKQGLHELINGHTKIEYSSSSFDVWDSHFVTDRRWNDAATAEIVYDMFSDNPAGAEPYEFTLGADRDVGTSTNNEGDFYNREHTYPKSWWGGGTGSLDTQYTDIHYVVPSDKVVNTKKWNYPLGENDGTSTSNPGNAYTSDNGCQVGDCTHPSYSGMVFEPIDAYKGDFARMYLYFSTRYNYDIDDWEGNYTDAMDGVSYTAFDSWLLQTLLDWHENDAVSQKETDRNNAVFSIQGNRNPFIDHPEYVYYIWGSSTDMGCPAFVPIELASFDVFALPELQSRLEWVSLSEINSSHFIIEHSMDGSNFRAVGDVFAQGESLEKVQYEFIHKNAQLGRNYYRLRMIDLDGSEEISKTVIVDHDKRNWIQVYPSIVKDEITFEWENSINQIQIEIFDMQGKLTKQWLLSNSDSKTLSVIDISSGAYFIRSTSGALVSTQKIIKN